MGFLTGAIFGLAIALIWVRWRYVSRGVTWKPESVQTTIESIDQNPSVAVLHMTVGNVYDVAIGGAFQASGYPAESVVARTPKELRLSEGVQRAYDRSLAGVPCVIFHDGEDGLASGRSYCSSFAANPTGLSIVTIEVTQALGEDRLGRIEAILTRHSHTKDDPKA